MARTRDWRRLQKRLHRGREKYTDWWHPYCRSDDWFSCGMHYTLVATGRVWRKRLPHILEELADEAQP